VLFKLTPQKIRDIALRLPVVEKECVVPGVRFNLGISRHACRTREAPVRSPWTARSGRASQSIADDEEIRGHLLECRGQTAVIGFKVEIIDRLGDVK
jgi:hypothetical protein